VIRPVDPGWSTDHGIGTGDLWPGLQIRHLAALTAVAMNLERLPIAPALEKYAEHERISSGFGLTRPINVEVAQNNGGKVEGAIEQPADLLQRLAESRLPVAAPS